MNEIKAEWLKQEQINDQSEVMRDDAAGGYPGSK